MIVVKNVHKRYLTDHGPGKWVLQGVDLRDPVQTQCRSDRW
jgi:capsular polysaccharide transport system ATP-binding protein